MLFPDLTIHAAHGLLLVPVDAPAPRDADVDQALVASFSSEYNRSGVAVARDQQDDQPLILESRGGQIAFSGALANLDVQFYGDHQKSPDLCREYFGKKMLRMLQAWNEVGARPVWTTIVIELKASLGDEPDAAGAHMRDHLLSTDLADDSIFDMKAQFGLRIADHYFVNLAVSPYQAKQVVRHGTAQTQAAVIRPWEGTVTDAGIDVNVEVNNRLRADVLRQHSDVDADEVREINELSWDLVAHVATPLISEGRLDLSQLQVLA